ncbi:MAG: response regulator [Cyanobacteria bacterium P01_D01_bin.56]
MTKIILLEQNQQEDTSLKEGLELRGYELTKISRAEKFLAAANSSPNLLLIDIDTPGVNGWQLVQHLRETPNTWDLPIIAICNRDTNVQLLLRAGFDSYFRKPVSLKHLFMRIDCLTNVTPAASKVKTAAPPTASVAPSPDTTEPVKAPRTTTTIVHVDDSSKDSQMMSDIITSAGYSYANISNSLQVLPELLERKPQLIFLDLVMPMANGYEVCAQIRRITAFSKTPIVIVTNNDGVVDRARAKVVGASGFLSKPIEEQRVLRMVRKYVNPFQKVPKQAQQSSIMESLNPFKVLARLRQKL